MVEEWVPRQESKQESIDKVADDYTTENKYHFNVEYVSEVYV